MLLPPAVEVAQSWIPGRYCAASDIVANVIGGVVGVLVGVTWIHLGAPRGTRLAWPQEAADRNPGACGERPIAACA